MVAPAFQYCTVLSWLTEPVLLLLFLGLAGFLATEASAEIEVAVQREHDDAVEESVESGVNDSI